jgi:type III secretory pathway component EscT
MELISLPIVGFCIGFVLRTVVDWAIAIAGA